VIEHKYTRPGSFIASLTVIDAEGYVDSEYRAVAIPDIEPPQAEAGPDIMVWEDSFVQLEALSSRDDSGECHFSWALSTGEVYSEARPVIFFPDPISVNATLTVNDDAGNSDEDSMRITVRDRTPPTVILDHPSSAPLGSSIELDASRSKDNVGITQFIWELGGGYTIKDKETVLLELSEARRYFVTLEVLDAEGNWNTTTVHVDCYDVSPPNAVLSVLPTPYPIKGTYLKNDTGALNISSDPTFLGVVLRNESYLFSVSEVYDDTGIGYIRWTFGDGSVGGGPITYHSYRSSGLYKGAVELIDLFNNTMVLQFSLLVLPSYNVLIIGQEKENITYLNTTINVRPEKEESPLLEIESVIIFFTGAVLLSMFIYESVKAVRSRRCKDDGKENGGVI